MERNPTLKSWILIVLLGVTVIASGCGSRKPNPDIFGSEESRVVGRKAAAIARSFLGVPYRFGGEDPSGFDCSGLTYYVYKNLGYNLPRRAEAQMKVGRYIPRDYLQPGDLVFFKSSKSGIHVGIFAGDGIFIHAPQSGRRIERQQIDDGYYDRSYFIARRVAG